MEQHFAPFSIGNSLRTDIRFSLSAYVVYSFHFASIYVDLNPFKPILSCSLQRMREKKDIESN